MEVEDGGEESDINVSRTNAINQQKSQKLNGTISGFIGSYPLHKESDPLQPKAIKSRSTYKIKEVKEVSRKKCYNF